MPRNGTTRRLGNSVRELRRKHGLSHRQPAALSGAHAQTIGRTRAGRPAAEFGPGNACQCRVRPASTGRVLRGRFFDDRPRSVILFAIRAIESARRIRSRGPPSETATSSPVAGSWNCTGLRRRLRSTTYAALKRLFARISRSLRPGLVPEDPDAVRCSYTRPQRTPSIGLRPTGSGAAATRIEGKDRSTGAVRTPRREARISTGLSIIHEVAKAETQPSEQPADS